MTDVTEQQPIEQATNPETSESAVLAAAKLVESDWLALGQQPISAESPAGENIRLEDDFGRIEQEIAKLRSLTNNQPVEWDLLAEWCREILANQSKDILVACYLTRALCESNVIKGLMTGLAINISLIENYWDQCQPPKKRLRGRIVAYDWLVEQCSPLVENYQFNVGNLENLKLLHRLLTELDDLLVERLEDNAPGLNELIQAIKRNIGSLEAEQRAQERRKEQKEKPAASESTANNSGNANAAANAPVATFSGSITNERDLINCYRATQDSLRAACEYLRAEGLGNPESFRINRFITWLGVTQLPPDTNGITQLRPPPKEKLQHYQGLVAAGKHHELIPEVENSISKSPYWLDGHCISHNALVACGFQESANAVVAGVRWFIKKFPNVVNLKFSDQTDFASAETKQWINLEVLADDVSGSASVALPLAGEDNEWEQAYQTALSLYREKKVAEAFAVFSDGCKQAYSKRALTFWRYYQARFCYETGQIALAIALLENINEELKTQGYDGWEPDVSAKVIELLIRSYKKQPENENPTERVAALHARLCQFDLATAYELSTN